MKRFTSTIAILAMTSTAALAANHTGDDADQAEMSDQTEMASNGDMGEMQGMLIRTRDITGGNIYTLNEADDEGWDSANVYDTVGTDWNDIGEIEDIVLSKDGKMIGIVAEVGGFLDIADKHVMIPVENVNLVAVDDTTYAYVTRMSEEELEALEGVDEGFWN